MQIERLLQIFLFLLENKHATAKMLSEKFDVSSRTIYRDIDALSLAGIPVYCTKGKNGGIMLMENFTIDRRVLSAQEKNQILFALQGLSASRYPDTKDIFKKLSALFQNKSASEKYENFIEIDFSPWGSTTQEKEKHKLLEKSLFSQTAISFLYTDSAGKATRRAAEPHRLFFKGAGWYVQAFCKNRMDFRTFRVSRMQDMQLLPERFERKSLPRTDSDEPDPTLTEIKMRFSPDAAYRVYDDYPLSQICKDEDGSLFVTVHFPLDSWVVSHLLSYGGQAEVLSPEFLREMIAKEAAKISKLYSENER